MKIETQDKFVWNYGVMIMMPGQDEKMQSLMALGNKWYLYTKKQPNG